MDGIRLSNQMACVTSHLSQKSSGDPQLVVESFQWYMSAPGRRKIMMTRCTMYRKISIIARGVENNRVGCSTLNIELVKSFLSHYHPKLIFGQHVFAPCAGISRFVVVVLERSDVRAVLEDSAKEIQQASVA